MFKVIVHYEEQRKSYETSVELFRVWIESPQSFVLTP